MNKWAPYLHYFPMLGAVAFNILTMFFFFIFLFCGLFYLPILLFTFFCLHNALGLTVPVTLINESNIKILTSTVSRFNVFQCTCASLSFSVKSKYMYLLVQFFRLCHLTSVVWFFSPFFCLSKFIVFLLYTQHVLFFQM